MRTFEQYIDEAYSFRLGGSQKKGFDQKQTFNELKVGDKVYQFAKGYKHVYEYTLQSKPEVMGNNVYMHFLGDFKLAYNYSDRDKEYSIVDHQYYNVFATSYDVLRDVMKKECYVNVDEYSVHAIKESYSFRLGGSQQKGFEQTKVKTFEELKEDDEIFYIEYDKSRGEMFAMRSYKLVENRKEDHDIFLYYDKDEYSYFHIEGDKAKKSTLNYHENYNGHVIKILSTTMEEALDKINSVSSKTWKEKDFEKY